MCMHSMALVPVQDNYEGEIKISKYFSLFDFGDFLFVWFEYNPILCIYWSESTSLFHFAKFFTFILKNHFFQYDNLLYAKVTVVIIIKCTFFYVKNNVQ